jgi:hypothetical protein
MRFILNESTVWLQQSGKALARIIMETWNREELYKEIWTQPMLKLAPKYGISSVMLGKVCRKLRIPVPGRGYWARKASGYRVSITPLPKLKDVPVIQRFKFPEPEPKVPRMPEPEPNDSEYLRIKEVESLEIGISAGTPLDRHVAATGKVFRSAQTDDRGYRSTRFADGVLDLHISERTLDRAIQILNTVVIALGRLGFQVSFHKEPRHALMKIFGEEIGFELIEKYNQIRIPESQQRNSIWGSKVRYEPNGILEFRVSHSRYGQLALRDHKRQTLEQQIPAILGAFLRQARAAKLGAERERQQQIAQRQREIERQKLSDLIREEEKKVSTLDSWVSNWVHARQYREFISALAEAWKADGKDLSPETDQGKKLIWMRQQADRLDPLAESPTSILDRKDELRGSW